MKSIFITLLFITGFLLLFSFDSIGQTFSWAKDIKSSYGSMGANAVAVDSNGNSYIAGSFQGTIDFDTIQLTSNGKYDIFLAKYNPEGNCLWAKQSGGANNDYGNGISVDVRGNICLTGSFSDTAKFGAAQLVSFGEADIFISKYDTDGNCIWVKQAGGSKVVRSSGVSSDINGNIYITGLFYGTASFDSIQLITNSPGDVFISKYNANGNCLWATQAGGDYNRASGISTDKNGNSYIIGSFIGNMKFGTKQFFSRGKEDIYIAKYDQNGNVLWAEQAGGNDYDYCNNAAVDPNGDLLITGSFQGTSDFGAHQLSSYSSNTEPDIYLAKYNSDGNCLWVTQAGSGSLDGGSGVSVDAAGNSFLTGYFEETAKFGTFQLDSYGISDVFVSKFDDNGNCLWVKQAGGYSSDQGYGIAVNSKGDCIISGYFQATAAFDAIHLSTGAPTYFITKISDAVLSAKDENNSNPEMFLLNQNYPNPFNPTTTIKYSLPEAGNVKLTVYNIIGSKVATIVNEYKSAGNYSVEFNASSLASGIYLYRLESGTYSAAKKLILIK